MTKKKRKNKQPTPKTRTEMRPRYGGRDLTLLVWEGDLDDRAKREVASALHHDRDHVYDAFVEVAYPAEGQTTKRTVLDAVLVAARRVNLPRALLPESSDWRAEFDEPFEPESFEDFEGLLGQLALLEAGPAPGGCEADLEAQLRSASAERTGMHEPLMVISVRDYEHLHPQIAAILRRQWRDGVATLIAPPDRSTTDMVGHMCCACGAVATAPLRVGAEYDDGRHGDDCTASLGQQALAEAVGLDVAGAHPELFTEDDLEHDAELRDDVTRLHPEIIAMREGGPPASGFRLVGCLLCGKASWNSPMQVGG